MKNKIICLVFAFCFTSSLLAQTKTSSKADSIEVITTVNSFVDAFSNLRWEEFQQFFAKDVTAFFPPSASRPARADGNEVLNIFSKVFENARLLGKTKIDIQPKEVRVQMLNNVAIVSFHLNDPDLFGRRSLVLEKRDHQWLIVHLHASGVPYKQ